MPATGLDLLLGVGIAYLLSCKQFRGKEILDLASMLPLALTGMGLLFLSLILASRLLGRRVGDLFRA
jgi:ABC-type Fe3+ transport system permease subunit